MKPALALACAAIVLLTIGTAAAAPSAVQYGRIAYAYAGSADRFQIYTVTSTGTDRRQLTKSRTLSSYAPSYTLRGYRIAFVRASTQRDIWTMSADGGNQRRLTWTRAIDEVDPVWSPDGTQIAFAVASPKAKAGIWIVDADGTHRRQLTSDAGANPTWEPRGDYIAYAAAGAIWVVRVSDGTQTQVTFPATYSDGTPYSDFEPAWSGDEFHIVFASDRGDAADSADQIDLWVVNVASASFPWDVTRLTKTASRDERNPAWSWDGAQVVYDSTDTFHGAASTQLGIISSDGTNPRVITHSCGDCAYLNVDPSWQPPLP